VGYGMSHLDIADIPGRITKKLMRHYFEGIINNTPALKANTPDTMWLGFAIGMRCAERIAAAMAEGGAT
jgi:hypothetical protein